MIKPIYEFLLWNNCSNNCEFCYQRDLEKSTTEQKRLALDKLAIFLDSGKIEKGSHILLVGGELFDLPIMFNNLVITFNKIIEKMIIGEIDLFYINTNLIYKRLNTLLYLLDALRLDNLIDRLKFTTSYDTIGRFNKKTEQLMLSNLDYIKEKYPEVNIVVNMILTKDLCTKILSKEFSIKQFSREHKVYINLLPFIVFNKELAAERALILKTLKFVGDEQSCYLRDYIYNFDLPQKKELYQFNLATEEFEYCSSDILFCSHSENFRLYSENKTCFVCDLKKCFDYVI